VSIQQVPSLPEHTRGESISFFFSKLAQPRFSAHAVKKNEV
jgi:hypothetical protein